MDTYQNIKVWRIMSEIMYMKAKNYDHAPRPILGLGPFSMVGTMRDLICIFMNMLVHMSKLFQDLHKQSCHPWATPSSMSGGLAHLQQHSSGEDSFVVSENRLFGQRMLGSQIPQIWSRIGTRTKSPEPAKPLLYGERHVGEKLVQGPLNYRAWGRSTSCLAPGVVLVSTREFLKKLLKRILGQPRN